MKGESQWRSEVLDPATMSADDIRAELQHDLSVYERVRHPISKQAMAGRINRLVEEMDRRETSNG
jgi:hypothetical protein